MHDEIKKLLQQKPADYLQAKALSQTIDEVLGLNLVSVEQNILKLEGQQNWSGLPVQSMQTPYAEFVELIDLLAPKPQQLWVDLGAAYGRLGIVLGLLAPDVEFRGYELMAERVAQGQASFSRLGLRNATLIHQDLSDPSFTPPAAHCYFIYDFGNQQAVEKTLGDLREISRRQGIVVVARGRGCRHWIQQGQPWLSDVIAPVHKEHYTIFRSAS